MKERVIIMKDILSRLCGCIELIFLIGSNADKAVISSGVMGCVSELLNNIYNDFEREISAVELENSD